MTTPGTTLEQELLEAAGIIEGGGGITPDEEAFATRLRQRGDRARDFPRVLSGELQIPGVCRPVTAAEMFAWIAGPIPSTAATAARCDHEPDCPAKYGHRCRCDDPVGTRLAMENPSTAAPETVPTERKP